MPACLHAYGMQARFKPSMVALHAILGARFVATVIDQEIPTTKTGTQVPLVATGPSVGVAVPGPAP
jgi:hypothetical protein